MELVDKYIGILEKGFTNINDYNDAVRQSKDLYLKTPQAQKELIESQIKMIKTLIAQKGETKELVAVLEMLESQLIATSLRMTAEQKLRKELISDMKQAMSDFAQFQIDSARQVADSKLAIINEEEQRELESLRARRSFQKASDKQKLQWEQEIINKHEKQEKKVRDEANKRMVEAFRIEQAIKIASAVSNTSEGYTKALAQGGFLFGIKMATVVAILGAAQVAMIAAQKPPKMAYGGLVGGQPHNQGGTMINAERGEYVVRKSAVDALGLETLNRINAGGGGGSVNISFSGNVLSKDFLEDEAIPQIKEALRRGGDIGIG